MPTNPTRLSITFVCAAGLALAAIGCDGSSGNYISDAGGGSQSYDLPPGATPDITIDGGAAPTPGFDSASTPTPGAEAGSTFDSGGGWPVDIGASEAGSPPPPPPPPGVDSGTAPPPPPPGGCNAHCDCPQGQLCSSGKCLSGFAPLYCCSKAGCPIGQACVDQNGSPGQCNGNTPPPPPPPGGGCKTDCDCTQGQACYSGSCHWTPYPAYCCSKQTCPWGMPCTTQQGTMSVCGQGGGGNNSCNVDCDCPQGQRCSFGGTCQQSAVPSYCCSKSGCPKYYPCTHANGGFGHCQ